MPTTRDVLLDRAATIAAGILANAKAGIVTTNNKRGIARVAALAVAVSRALEKELSESS